MWVPAVGVRRLLGILMPDRGLIARWSRWRREQAQVLTRSRRLERQSWTWVHRLSLWLECLEKVNEPFNALHLLEMTWIEAMDRRDRWGMLKLDRGHRSLVLVHAHCGGSCRDRITLKDDLAKLFLVLLIILPGIEELSVDSTATTAILLNDLFSWKFVFCLTIIVSWNWALEAGRRLEILLCVGIVDWREKSRAPSSIVARPAMVLEIEPSVAGLVGQGERVVAQV